MSRKQYTKEDCISALKEAEEILGHEPSQHEYKSLDLSPSYQTIADNFGRWNKAKKAANMSTNRPSHLKYQDGCPNILSYSEKEWENLTKNLRFRRRIQAKVAEMKLSSGCNECGFDEHPAALEFHHTNPESKFNDISHMITQGYSMDRIYQEIEKCEILCSNCHKIEENKEIYSV